MAAGSDTVRACHAAPGDGGVHRQDAEPNAFEALFLTRDTLGLRARVDRGGAEAQLGWTAPPPECPYKQTRGQVRLPWGRRRTAYDATRMEDEDS
eukprot:15388892-Alexandrium_andersonii.AAC.1